MAVARPMDPQKRGERQERRRLNESGTQELKKTATDSTADYTDGRGYCQQEHLLFFIRVVRVIRGPSVDSLDRQSGNKEGLGRKEAQKTQKRYGIGSCHLSCAFCALLWLCHLECSGVHDPQMTRITQWEIVEVRGGEGGSISSLPFSSPRCRPFSPAIESDIVTPIRSHGVHRHRTR